MTDKIVDRLAQLQDGLKHAEIEREHAIKNENEILARIEELQNLLKYDFLTGKINLKQLKVRIENLANEYSPKY